MRDAKRIGLLLFLGISVRVAMVHFFTPSTDVYYFMSEGVETLLSGKNPYAHEFHSIPKNLETPGAHSVFAYLPGSLLYMVPFHLLGDVRFGGTFADAVMALSLYYLSRQVSGQWAIMVSSFYLFFPPFPIITSIFGNNTMVSASLISLTILLITRGKRLWILTYCLSLMTSQIALLTLPLFLLHAFRKKVLILTVFSLTVSSLVSLPFLLSSPQEFLNDTLFFQFSRETYRVVDMVGDALVLNVGLNGAFFTITGFDIPLVLRLVLLLLALVFLVLKPYTEPGKFFPRVGSFLAIAIFLIPKNVFPTYFLIPLPFILPFLSLGKRFFK